MKKSPDIIEQSSRGTFQPQWFVGKRLIQRSGIAFLGVIVTVIAVLQSPYEDPYVELDGLGWWIYPFEINAAKRLPAIDADLRAVAIRQLPESTSATARRINEEIWIVGDGCFVARSFDDGKTWEQIAVLGDNPRGQYSSELTEALTLSPGALIPAPIDRKRAPAAKNAPGPRSKKDENEATSSDEASIRVSAPAGYLFTSRPAQAVVAIESTPETKSEWGDYPLRPLNFYDIEFIGDKGWIVGDGGTILHTSDGGVTWERQHSGVPHVLNAVSFSDDQSGWVVGAKETILSTVDGGRHWKPHDIAAEDLSKQQPTPTSLDDSFVACAAANIPGAVAVAAQSGTIHISTNEGRTWKTKRDAGVAPVTDVFYPVQLIADAANSPGPDEPYCVIAGPAGTELAAYNEKFEKLEISDLENHLKAVAPLAIGQKPGDLLRLAHYARTLNNPTTKVFTQYGSAAVSLPHRATADSTFASLPALPPLSTICIKKPGHLWYAGFGGLVTRSTDDGTTWVAVSRFCPKVPGPNSPDGKIRLATTALSTSDDHQDDYFYYPSELGPESKETGIDQWSASNVGSYVKLPAPWYWILFLPAFGYFVVREVRRELPPAPEAVRESVEPVAASDRPIEVGDPDPLRFGDIAAGLSRFIRNEKTEPPLTIGITGGWGSGKTSLMNLLKGDLVERGFRPVWFNAWHHQQESHMLASLLATIKADGTPRIWQIREWLRFRLQLLSLRARNQATWVFCLLFAVAASAGYFWFHPRSLTVTWTEFQGMMTSVQSDETPRSKPAEDTATPGYPTRFMMVDRLVNAASESEILAFAARHAQNSTQESLIRERLQRAKTEGLFDDSGPLDDSTRQRRLEFLSADLDKIAAPVVEPIAEESSPVTKTEGSALLILITGVFGLIFSVIRGVKAFGVEPGQLMATVSGSMKIRDLSAEAGFRYHFAKEFNDVTTALYPRSLVILIDDLDRCQPQHVMETLEMVNFLVSSGKCIVIMGLAKQRVVQCIAGEFREIAADETPESFATNYLEKIINVELAVPRISRAQAQVLMSRTDDSSDERKQESPRAIVTLLRKLPNVSRTYTQSALVILTVTLGFFVGARLLPTSTEKSPNEPALKGLSTSVDGALSESAASDADRTSMFPVVDPLKDVSPLFRASLLPGEESTDVLDRILFVMMILLGVALAGFAFLQNKPVVYKDSPVFVDALGIWLNAITLKPFTPRSLKQFLNHVRFVSMRYSTEIREPTRYEWFLQWLEVFLRQKNTSAETGISAAAPASSEAERESVFVFLCAVYKLDSRLIVDDDWWEFLSNGCAADRSPAALNAELQQALHDAVAEHRKAFSQAWPISAEDRQLFLNMNRNTVGLLRTKNKTSHPCVWLSQERRRYS